MRFSRLLAAALSVGIFSIGPVSAAPDPIEINVVISMTGGAGFLGAKEAQGLSIFEKDVNAAGGINNRPIKFVFSDDASSPQNTVQLVNALIAKHAPVIIGPSVVATCAAVLPLVSGTGPVSYCLATPVQAPAGTFMVTQGADAKGYPASALRHFREHGLKRVALITATDASGQAYERDFDSAMSSNDFRGFQLVAREHFSTSDISMAAQIARIKAAAPDAILSFSVGPSFGTLLRNLYDAGMNVPVVSSAANLSAALLEPMKAFAPKELLFVANLGATPQANARGELRAAQARFYAAFQEAGVRPEVLHTTVWDAALLTVAALKKLGPNATASQVRDYLLQTRNWTGIYGKYDFPAYPQRGLGPDSLVIYRWDSATSAMALLPS